jgi:site-specific recombinase XerD
LRAFLRFCERRKWIDDNPALNLKAPKIQNRPTMPFAHAEMIKVLEIGCGFFSVDRMRRYMPAGTKVALLEFLILLQT